MLTFKKDKDIKPEFLLVASIINTAIITIGTIKTIAMPIVS